MPEQTSRSRYGAKQFADHLGLSRWQLRVGLEHGILPGPDLGGEQWSADLADESRDAGREVIARFGDQPPIGSARAAAMLAARVSLDVERRDIEVLVAHGALNVVSSFRGHPVYLMRDLDRLDPEAVRKVVFARKGPLTDTVDTSGAAAILGWPSRTFDRIAAERGLEKDRLGRYALTDVHALRADDDLACEMAQEKRSLALVTARRSEAHFEDAVHAWILRCSAYVDRDADEPPAIAPLSRALRSLGTVRAEIDEHERPAA